MSTLAPSIHEKYDEHAALLDTISRTEYAVPSYESNEDRIKKLQEKAERRKKKLEKLKVKTQSEYKDFQEIKRSVTKRFILRIKSGKEGVEKKTAKEEEEYLEAFSEEQDAKAEIAVIEREQALAIKARDELKADAEAHAKAQKKLQELYEALFSGTTRDFPEEDKAEEAVKAARDQYNEAQTKLNRELSVQVALKKAEKAMKKACKNMEQAEEYSLRDLVSTNALLGAHSGQELHAAKAHAVEALLFVKEAREISTEVRELPALSIPILDRPASQSLTFDGDSESAHIHRLIALAVKEADRYFNKLETERERSDERLKALTKETSELQAKLLKYRGELDEIRKSIFLKVKKGVVRSDSETGAWVPSAGLPEPEKQHSLPEYYSRDPSFPVPNEPKHRPSLPAGGFKDSRSGSIVLDDEPANLTSPSFPDGPGFAGFPVNPPQHIPPGFRVAAMEADASKATETVEAITFPKPELGRVNPYAAFMLMHANDSDSGDEAKSPKMPKGPSARDSDVGDFSPPSMPGALPKTTQPSHSRQGSKSNQSPSNQAPSARTAELVAIMKDVNLKDAQQMLPKPPKPADKGAAPGIQDIKMPSVPSKTK